MNYFRAHAIFSVKNWTKKATQLTAFLGLKFSALQRFTYSLLAFKQFCFSADNVTCLVNMLIPLPKNVKDVAGSVVFSSVTGMVIFTKYLV